MTVETLKEIAGKIATPAYVFDESEFAERAKGAKEQLGPEIGICYSMKANPFLTCKNFDPCALFEKLEVCSPGELHICMHHGIPADRILFSGLNKNAREIEEAYDAGVRLFTAESRNQLKALDETGRKKNDPLQVLIRIAADSQFGMDEADVLEAIRNRETTPFLRIRGVHYFTGTQKRNSSVIQKELAYLKDFCRRAEAETGFRIENVEYGPGLNVEYFEEESNSATDLEDIVPALRELASVTKVTVEMGRWFAAACGFYFTGVMDCKQNGGTNYAVTDGGMHQLHYDGQIRSMKVPMHVHLSFGEPAGEEEEKWTVCGSICSAADILCRDVAFQNLQENDILVFLNCGAYSFMEASSTFLSREMPQIWARRENGELELLRDFFPTEQLNWITHHGDAISVVRFPDKRKQKERGNHQ